MKKILSLIFLTVSNNLYAAGGFTWFSGLSKATHIPEHVLTFSFVGLLMVIVGLTYRSKMSNVGNIVIPDSKISFRNIVEMYGDFIYGQCKSIIGEKEGPKYFGFVATIFIVILLSNLIGLIPGFLPPTEYTSTTLALGVFSFVYYNIKGCKEQGVLNYCKHFCGPLWYLAFLIFPIEIISNLVRPLSLALRLKNNMMGDHLVLVEFSNLIPGIVPIVFLMLGILVSLIQAYVFTVLSIVYISLAVSHHDHDEEHAH